MFSFVFCLLAAPTFLSIIIGLTRIDNMCCGHSSTTTLSTNLNNNLQNVHHYSKPSSLFHYNTDRSTSTSPMLMSSSRHRYNLNSATPTFTLQSPLQHRPIVENISTDNYNSCISNSQFNYGIRRASSQNHTLRRSDSYSPGK